MGVKFWHNFASRWFLNTALVPHLSSRLF